MVSKEAQPSRAVRPGEMHNLLSVEIAISELGIETEISAKEYTTVSHTSVMLLSLLQAKSMVDRVWLPTPIIWALG